MQVDYLTIAFELSVLLLLILLLSYSLGWDEAWLKRMRDKRRQALRNKNPDH